MREMMAGSPCGSFMRRHPVLASVFLVAMGLMCLVVPAAMILGVIAFFHTS